MIEVQSQFFVGSQRDYETVVKHEQGWRVVHACKEPYHRDALGYSGRAASKNHPEYLIARRDNRLILNLIDADDPKYIPRGLIDASVEFIHESLDANFKVLVHCNQGLSRAPSIAFLFIAAKSDRFIALDLQSALKEFRMIYPPYSPATGMSGFIASHYALYRRS